MRFRIDMLIYRLFVKWLNGFLVRNPRSALLFQRHINNWVKVHINPPAERTEGEAKERGQV